MYKWMDNWTKEKYNLTILLKFIYVQTYFKIMKTSVGFLVLNKFSNIIEPWL